MPSLQSSAIFRTCFSSTLTYLSTFVFGIDGKRLQEELLVLDTSRSRELDDVVKHADAPLVVGPGTARLQEIDKVLRNLIEERQELLAVSRK